MDNINNLIDSTIQISAEYDENGEISNLICTTNGNGIFGFSGEFIKAAAESPPWYELNHPILRISDVSFELKQYFQNTDCWIGQLINYE